MARDTRWHTGWILAFIAMQFVLALSVLITNGVYWRKYGGVVHQLYFQATEPGETSFTENIYQVTTPLNMYIFGISAATLAVALIDTITYLFNALHPLFLILVNIILFLAWGGCLAVFFFWGGGLAYTGTAWVSQYHDYCLLQQNNAVSGYEYIPRITCGGEKLLLIMLPFICLNIILCPLFVLFALVSLVLNHTRSRHPTGPTPSNIPPTQQQPTLIQRQHNLVPPPNSIPPIANLSPQTPPQPFIHQGVLYQPVGIAQPGYSSPGIELSGHPAPTREMPGQSIPVELVGGDQYEKGTPDQK